MQPQVQANPNADPFATAAPVAPVHQPSWWQKLLPTAGSVLGGIAGLPLNALDAVTGIGGTAADIGLAGAGGALGKALENHFTGQGTGSAGSLLGAGAEGAIGQGVGMGIGTIGSKVLGAVGNKATSTATDLIQGQASKGFLSDAEANALREKGITDLRQVPSIFNEVSGSNGMFPNMVKGAFAQSDNGVNISGLDTVANNLAAENGNLDTVSIKQINSALNTAVNNSIPGDVAPVVGSKGDTVFTYTPGALQNALPENTFAQTQKLEQLANAAYKKGFDPYTKQVTDPRNAGLYNVFKGMADHMENASFGGDAPIPLTSEMKTELLNSDQMTNLANINPKAAASYAQDIGNAENLQDLRGAQSLIVRANNAVQGTANKAGLAVGTNAMDVARGAGAPLSLALNHPVTALGSLLMASPAADRIGATVLDKIGPALASKTQSLITPAIGGALGAGTATAVGAPANPAGSGDAINANINPVTPQGAAVNPLNPSGNNIFTSLVNPNQPGAGNQQPIALQALLGMFDPNLLNAQNEGAATTGAQNIQRAQLGANVLPQLEQEFNLAGGAQGPVGGTLAKLGAMVTGGPAGQVGAQTDQAAQALATATGLPINEIKAAMPKITQNKSSADIALQNIQNLLATLGANTGSNQNSSPNVLPSLSNAQ